MKTEEQLKQWLDIEESKFISWDIIEMEWCKRVAEITSGLSALEDRLIGLIEGKTRDEVKEIVHREVIDLRDAYAKDGKYTPKV